MSFSPQHGPTCSSSGVSSPSSVDVDERKARWRAALTSPQRALFSPRSEGTPLDSNLQAQFAGLSAELDACRDERDSHVAAAHTLARQLDVALHSQSGRARAETAAAVATAVAEVAAAGRAHAKNEVAKAVAAERSLSAAAAARIRAYYESRLAAATAATAGAEQAAAEALAGVSSLQSRVDELTRAASAQLDELASAEAALAHRLRATETELHETRAAYAALADAAAGIEPSSEDAAAASIEPTSEDANTSAPPDDAVLQQLESALAALASANARADAAEALLREGRQWPRSPPPFYVVGSARSSPPSPPRGHARSRRADAVTLVAAACGTDEAPEADALAAVVTTLQPWTPPLSEDRLLADAAMAPDERLVCAARRAAAAAAERLADAAEAAAAVEATRGDVARLLAMCAQ